MIAQTVYAAVTTLDWKWVLAFATLFFNAGGMIYVMTNHVRHLAADMKEVKTRLRGVEEDVSYIKGKLDASS